MPKLSFFYRVSLFAPFSLLPLLFTPLSQEDLVAYITGAACAFALAEGVLHFFSFRTLCAALAGLSGGYVGGLALLSLTALDASPFAPLVMCATLYFGLLLALKGSASWSAPQQEKKYKPLVLDLSTLSDSRLLDFACSGLLDDRLVLPTFVENALYQHLEDPEESLKVKACLTLVKKLKELPLLNLQPNSTDFPETKDLSLKTSRLALQLGGDILTSDTGRLPSLPLDTIRFINLHTLANSLKPIICAGESLLIKVQRYGKEPRQGVGYLDDGTMVVVNGGASFIGETIRASVLSVKHTSSGRMIFCNAPEDSLAPQMKEPALLS